MPTTHRPPPLIDPTRPPPNPPSLASYTPSLIPPSTSSSTNSPTIRPCSPVYEFLVVLPSITRGYRPPPISSSATSVSGGDSLHPPHTRSVRANSHQFGTTTGGYMGGAGAGGAGAGPGDLGGKLRGGPGAGHRASVPNTASYSTLTTNKPMLMGVAAGEISSSSTMSSSSGVSAMGTRSSDVYRANPFGMGGRTVVPSLFPRKAGGESNVLGSGSGSGQGMTSGTISPGGSPLRSRRTDEDNYPVSPGSSSPLRTSRSPRPPGAGGTSTPPLQRAPVSASASGSGSSPTPLTPSTTSHHRNQVNQMLTDPQAQGGWKLLPPGHHLHVHARRASIGNLAPSGMRGMALEAMDSDDEMEEENEEEGRQVGGGGVGGETGGRTGSPASSTRSGSGGTSGMTSRPGLRGTKSNTGNESGGMRRGRRPKTSGGVLGGGDTVETMGLSTRASMAAAAMTPAGPSEGAPASLSTTGSPLSNGSANDPNRARSGSSSASLSLSARMDPPGSTSVSTASVNIPDWNPSSSTSGLLGKRSRGTGTGRPGWEGEEVVGVLREDGMPVTTFRSTTQMSRHLRNLSAMAEVTATKSGSSPAGGALMPSAVPSSSFIAPLSRVLLVPLSDSPTLPSLSLLLAQGTTPSAICFQQDLLDRARRTEADWLPSALNMISTATRRGSDATNLDQDPSAERSIHVIAYSANPALAPSVVDECLRAGAIGVLQPPYDNDMTLQTIRRMIMWAERSDQVRRSFDHAEMEGEEVQPADVSFVRQEEQLLDDAAGVPGFEHDLGEPGSPDGSIDEPHTPTEAELKTEPAKTLYSHLAAYDFNARRRSVDNGGLSLALERADRLTRQNRLKSTSDLLTPLTAAPPFKQDRSSSLAGLEGYLVAKQEGGAEGDATIIAELLGEMYRQTRISIEIQMIDYPEFSAPMESDHRARLIEALSTWNFRPHALNEADLFRCACLLFEAVLRVQGLSELGIKQDQVNRLLFAIRAIYHAPNPYHNYIHAVDVLQASYTFLVAVGVAPQLSILLDKDSGSWSRAEIVNDGNTEEYNANVALQSILRPQDVLAIMIAAMGHDVGHPGLSNVFMKNAKTPLSQVYEDKSVLENMHCMLIVQLLRKHGFSFLLQGSNPSGLGIALPTSSHFAGPSEDISPLTSEFPEAPSTAVGTSFRREEKAGAIHDWKGFKKLLYATVLATDMSIHFNWIKRYIDYGKRMRANGVQSLSLPEEEEARILLSQAIIKCADISNPTRPIEVSEHWSTVLLAEWANQASLEQELQLPVSVVASADAAIQAKGQIGFIDLFTLPLFDAAADAMPGLRPYAESCGVNRALWQDRFDAINALSSTEPPPPIKGASNSSNSLSSLEDRYRNLFPLSLPRSMFQGSDVQSPVASTPSAQSVQSNAVDEAALHDTHSMRAAYIEHTTRRKSSVRIPTVRARRFQE